MGVIMKTIVILYDGITGSTNLMSILNKNTYINVLPGYNPFGSGSNLNKDYIDNKISTINWSEEKINCFKFRYTGNPMIYGHTQYIVEKFDTFLILIRRNYFHHVLSELIKDKTDQANVKINEVAKNIDPFLVNEKQFIDRINEKKHNIDVILNILKVANKKYMLLDYDNLFEMETLNSMYDFFGCGGDGAYLGDYNKLNNVERYKKLIINFNELEKIYENLRK